MTSAELKLLRRRLILRKPGLPDLVAGATTADALVVIHASGGLCAPVGRAFNEFEEV